MSSTLQCHLISSHLSLAQVLTLQLHLIGIITYLLIVLASERLTVAVELVGYILHSYIVYVCMLHSSYIIYTIEAMIPFKCSAEVETTTNLGSSLAFNSIKKSRAKSFVSGCVGEAGGH